MNTLQFLVVGIIGVGILGCRDFGCRDYGCRDSGCRDFGVDPHYKCTHMKHCFLLSTGSRNRVELDLQKINIYQV